MKKYLLAFALAAMSMFAAAQQIKVATGSPKGTYHALFTDIAGVFDEHHHAGVNDREALRVVQGYGIPQSPLRREQAHRRPHRDAIQWDTPERHVRVNRAGQYLP